MLECTAKNEDHRNKVALQIRQHISKRGHEQNIIITPSMARYWWKKLNIAVFNGLLRPPKRIYALKWVGDVDTYGECDPQYDRHMKRYVNIRLKESMETRKLFLTILVHEMVHQWEWETLEKTSHHKHFYMWKDTIRRMIDLPLAKLVDDVIDD